MRVKSEKHKTSKKKKAVEARFPRNGVFRANVSGTGNGGKENLSQIGRKKEIAGVGQIGGTLRQGLQSATFVWGGEKKGFGTLKPPAECRMTL